MDANVIQNMSTNVRVDHELCGHVHTLVAVPTLLHGHGGHGNRAQPHLLLLPFPCSCMAVESVVTCQKKDAHANQDASTCVQIMDAEGTYTHWSLFQRFCMAMETMDALDAAGVCLQCPGDRGCSGCCNLAVCLCSWAIPCSPLWPFAAKACLKLRPCVAPHWAFTVRASVSHCSSAMVCDGGMAGVCSTRWSVMACVLLSCCMVLAWHACAPYDGASVQHAMRSAFAGCHAERAMCKQGTTVWLRGLLSTAGVLVPVTRAAMTHVVMPEIVQYECSVDALPQGHGPHLHMAAPELHAPIGLVPQQVSSSLSAHGMCLWQGQFGLRHNVLLVLHSRKTRTFERGWKFKGSISHVATVPKHQ
eukprot:scaffold25948_cov27-Tisochrysis_lutea.AAC.1